MHAFTKIIRIGAQPEFGSTFCKIVFAAGKLSIVGVEGPTRDGNCRGGCGQLDMHEWRFNTYAPGWDAERVQRFREVWERWHLNDMRAGSPAQSEFLRQNPIADHYHHYTKACEALRVAGLNPDPNYLHEGKPYRYSSAWLREEVPTEVLEWLAALPDTDVQPAWV